MSKPKMSETTYRFEYHRKRNEEGSDNWELKNKSFEKIEKLKQKKISKFNDTEAHKTIWVGVNYFKQNKDIIEIIIMIEGEHDSFEAAKTAKEELDNFLSYSEK